MNGVKSSRFKASTSSTRIDTLICPFCRYKTAFEVNTYKKEIICEQCKKPYFVIICIFCLNPIYYKKSIYYLCKYIKCPYSNCGLKFSLYRCLNCKEIIFLEYTTEGNLIDCPYCKENFKELKCPKITCQNIISITQEYIEGAIISCLNHNGVANNTYQFQKVSCIHCSRSIVFDNSKDIYYLEGQKIVCPYSDCRRSFNKVICPKCNKYICISNGDLYQGSEIRCVNYQCGHLFMIIYCPACFKVIKLDKTSKYEIELRLITCTRPTCKCQFQIVNCLFCHQTIHYISPKLFIKYSTVTCPNDDCNNSFAKIKCPSCSLQFFKINQKSIFGDIIICLNESCGKKFTLFFCERCKQIMIKKYEYKYDSICDNCQNNMAHIRCPYCLEEMDKIGNKISNSKIICSFCNKMFYFMTCPFCNCDMNLKKYSNLNIKCHNYYCNKIFSVCKCSRCKNDNYIESSSINNAMEIDEIYCQNCHFSYEITEEKDTENIMKVQRIDYKGKKKIISIKNGEVDEFDDEIINEIIDVNEYNDNYYYEEIKNSVIKNEFDMKNKEITEECVICKERPRESVFYPCGHRCTCYQCGKTIYKRSGICPMCKTKIEYLLKCVIDA